MPPLVALVTMGSMETPSIPEGLRMLGSIPLSNERLEMSVGSANFDFLAPHDGQLVRLGALAERFFRVDPNTCIIKLRQFAELLAQLTAVKAGLYTSSEESQADLLRRLAFERVLPREVADLFHQLRIAGNRVAHGVAPNQTGHPGQPKR